MKATTVRATVRKGRLVPLEELDLPEGHEVTLTINEEAPSAREIERLIKQTAGAWKGIVDSKRFLRDVYRSRRRISRRAAPRL